MNETKTILLINGFWTPAKIIDEFLSNSETDSNIFLTFPLGIMTLAGWCRQKLPDYNLKIIDFMTELHKYLSTPDKKATSFVKFVNHILERIRQEPDYIGISFGSSNGHKANLQLAAICKTLWPSSRIIVGGTHATTFTRQIIEDSNIDFVIRGPGDIAFTQLIEALEADINPNSIPGVITEVNNASSLAPILKDLSQIPRPPYDLIDMEYLVVNDATAPIFKEGARPAMIMTSRGCPFSCTYCAASQVHGKKVHFANIDKVVNDIEYLINNYKVNQICIIDDLFGVDKNYFYDFFKEIDDRKLKFKVVIPAGLSIVIYDEQMIDVLIAHGLDAVYFPLESGSKYVQDNVIKKRVNLEKSRRLISYAKSKNLFTGINIVLGTPGETREMMNETYEFILTLPVDWIAFFSAYPYPGTTMTDILLERGELTEKKLLEVWDNSTQGFKKRSFDTREIKGDELGELVYDFNIKLNFFNNYNIRTKNYNQIIPKLDKIIERYPFHVVALACRAKCYNDLNFKDKAAKDIHKISERIKQNDISKEMYYKYESNINDFLKENPIKN